MSKRIEFTVIGAPKPQGSKRTVPIYRDGKPVMKGNRTLTRVAPDNPKLPEWRQEVAHAARQAYAGDLLAGALRLWLLFMRPRPKSHFRTGRNANVLRDNAPEYPIVKPDTVKLARAVEDSLTGVVWRDDSQVVDHGLFKRYGSHFRVAVRVEEVDGSALADVDAWVREQVAAGEPLHAIEEALEERDQTQGASHDA
jgi:Holliday junction resolvase RusA-like endonuclease